ncbi:MAG: L,D-transpeptidase family protein [Gammaproteobacteria bacterium]|jgi:L,D-transpeptidase ErfK/SrfK|nr:L,D-transpeptidase family protein [Gammaproteobacteria bacterium]
MNKQPKTTIKWMSFVVSSMLWIGTLAPQTSFGLTFVIPHNGNIIGNIQYTSAQYGDSLSTIGRRYDMGGYEMVEANPGVNYLEPNRGTRIVVPSRFVLPDTPRKGIVINLSEMRLYYYHPDGVHVSTYPVGVGQEGWNTPLGTTTVTRKREHPTWVVPDSILANHEAHGQPIEKVWPAGPNNPLGDYAMNTGFKSIVIHGSPYPKGVGVRSSHGCIRMLNEDVEQLFKMVQVGTPVNIIHQPTKIGRLDNKLYLEAHVPLSNAEYYAGNVQSAGQLIHKVVNGAKYSVEWREIEKLQNRANGYPQPIGSIN